MSDIIKTESNVEPVAASPVPVKSEAPKSKRGRKPKAKLVEVTDSEHNSDQHNSDQHNSDQLDSGDDEQKPQKRVKKERVKKECVKKEHVKKERVPWTADEEALLMEGVKRGLSWGQLSREVLPLRGAPSCKVHYAVLTKHSNGEWSNDEDEKLRGARKRCAKLWNEYWDAVVKELGGPRGRDECMRRYEEYLKK